jgi:hypothetical protein
LETRIFYKIVLEVLLIIGLGVFYVHSSPPLSQVDWPEKPVLLKKGSVFVFHAPADSQIAHKTAEFLQNTYNELVFDFRISKNDSFKVIIAPTRDSFFSFRADLPDWTQALAIPSAHTMVVKSPRWDPGRADFEYTLAHELVHLVTHKIVGNREIPRWMDEGLATFYSKEQRWRTMTALSKAATTHSLIPLTEIDHVLKFQRARAELAYQQSYSAVEYLLRTYDTEAIRTILRGVRQGWPMDRSFRKATGSTFSGFENEWKQWVYDNYKWYWLSEIDSFIWVLILLLAVLAIVIIRWRNRRKIANWHNEDEQDNMSVDQFD